MYWKLFFDLDTVAGIDELRLVIKEIERLELSTEVVKAFLFPLRSGFEKITVDTIKTIKNCFIGEYRIFHDFFWKYLSLEWNSSFINIKDVYVQLCYLVDPELLQKLLLEKCKIFRSGNFYFKEPKEDEEK